MIIQVHYLNKPLVLMESDVRLNPYDRITVGIDDYIVDTTRFLVVSNAASNEHFGAALAQHVYVSKD